MIQFLVKKKVFLFLKKSAPRCFSIKIEKRLVLFLVTKKTLTRSFLSKKVFVQLFPLFTEFTGLEGLEIAVGYIRVGTGQDLSEHEVVLTTMGQRLFCV